MDIITKKGFRYNLAKLDSTLDEFLFVKEFFNKNTKKKANYEDIKSHQVKDFQIHKVIESKPTTATNEKSNNLMLFHGTGKIGKNDNNNIIINFFPNFTCVIHYIYLVMFFLTIEYKLSILYLYKNLQRFIFVCE